MWLGEKLKWSEALSLILHTQTHKNELNINGDFVITNSQLVCEFMTDYIPLKHTALEVFMPSLSSLFNTELCFFKSSDICNIPQTQLFPERPQHAVGEQEKKTLYVRTSGARNRKSEYLCILCPVCSIQNSDFKSTDIVPYQTRLVSLYVRQT